MINNHYSLRKILRFSLAAIGKKSASFKGKARLIRVMDDWLREDDEPITKNIGSVNYQLDTKDIIDFRVFYFGASEKSILAYLSRQIGSSQSILWDVGANVGSVCLPLLAACPGLEIHAFEPSPSVFTRLEVNVNLNSFISKRIHLYNAALSNSSKIVDFFVSNEPHNSGVGSLGKMHNTVDSPVKISSYKGDDLITIKSLQKPSFIKIDTEGFEHEVLEGLMSFLETSRDVQVVFEHEPYRLDERKQKRESVVRLLQNFGFRLYRIDGDDGCLTELHEAMLMTHCDFVACK